MTVLHAMSAGQKCLAILCGALVSFCLGLAGSGGSILAVPLTLYVVGIADPHVAIGTSACAVLANAFLNIISHARAGHVRWGMATVFTAGGVLGALVGSTLGKHLAGQHLLALFALLVAFVAVRMLVVTPPGERTGTASSSRYPRLLGAGLGTGSLAGFFGIGGGFLIVPSLLFFGHLTMVEAIGTSLFAVGSFALTTAINYASSDCINWFVAAAFVLGGLAGGRLGASLAKRLAMKCGALNRLFAGMLVVVALYILIRSWQTV
ncbi:sulfite exporter TauE/SafE family protein [Paraburkholderia sp. CI3]|uniref:sulfite exporter TauE/SafE family protein n=1 Tax=Paraburkholderia sp. CI3 TaxID=2991060 RepID=UPI003D2152E6